MSVEGFQRDFYFFSFFFFFLLLQMSLPSSFRTLRLVCTASKFLCKLLILLFTHVLHYRLCVHLSLSGKKQVCFSNRDKMLLQCETTLLSSLTQGPRIYFLCSRSSFFLCLSLSLCSFALTNRFCHSVAGNDWMIWKYVKEPVVWFDSCSLSF